MRAPERQRRDWPRFSKPPCDPGRSDFPSPVLTWALHTIYQSAGLPDGAVTLLGVMAAPAMKRSGYDIRLSAGVITAGGTLGILIPPSVMLIVMGPVVGVPATDLFAAAVIPGLLLSGLYIIYALVRSYLNPTLGPALPVEERAASFGIVVKELLLGIAPIVVVILATLGVILAGIPTPAPSDPSPSCC